MKKLILVILIAVCPQGSRAESPKYGPNAIPLSAMSNLEYFKNNKGSDYWTLSPYYLSQETERGCSAANIAMILNAARAKTKLTSSDKLITFKSFVEKYSDENYRKAIMGKSLTTGTNFSNKNLARLLNDASKKLKLESAHAEFVMIDPKNIEKSRKNFFSQLHENEKTADDFIFFSYIQGKITGDPEGGAHVATVGAYDEKKKLVLVMDPDREWYEPYWTPADTLFDAINDPKSDSRQEAGWVYFKTK